MLSLLVGNLEDSSFILIPVAPPKDSLG
jgi:hypothetical protein